MVKPVQHENLHHLWVFEQSVNILSFDVARLFLTNDWNRKRILHVTFDVSEVLKRWGLTWRFKRLEQKQRLWEWKKPLDYPRRNWFEGSRRLKEILTVSERLRTIAINSNVVSETIASGSSRIDSRDCFQRLIPPWVRKIKFNGRRIRYGKANSVGDLSYHNQDKGKER